MATRNSQQSLPRVIASGEPITDWRLGRLQFRPSHVPANWELAPIVTVARLESGHTPSRKRPEYWNGNIPWVSLHDTKRLDVREIYETEQTISQLGLDNSSARLLPKGTVVFSRTATVGKCTVMGREMATSQDFANYICGPKLHNHYLVQLFRHLEPEWQRLMAGSTHSTVYMPVFEQLQVLLPPVEEQRKIAAILSSIDEVIEKTGRVIEGLQVVKKALIQELLTRGFPGRHTRFKRTAIGEIPEGWRIVALSELALVQTGVAKGKPVTNGVELPYLRVANVQDGHVSLGEIKTIAVDVTQIERYRLRRGDVLFTEGGDADKLGRGCVWQAEIDPCLHQNHVFAVRTNPNVLLPEFLGYWASSPRGKEYFLSCAKQTTNLASINSTQLKALPIPLASIEEQSEIVRFVASMDARIQAERSAREGLVTLKMALMSVLLNGEVRVLPEEGAA